MAIIDTLFQIASSFNDQLPSTGKDIEDAFNQNFEKVKQSVNNLEEQISQTGSGMAVQISEALIGIASLSTQLEQAIGQIIYLEELYLENTGQIAAISTVAQDLRSEIGTKSITSKMINPRFSSGTIDADTGEPTGNNTRIRTNLLPLGRDETVILNNASNLEVESVMCYLGLSVVSVRQYTGTLVWDGSFTSFRIIFKNLYDTTLDNTDLEDALNNIELQYQSPDYVPNSINAGLIAIESRIQNLESYVLGF